MLNIKKDDDLNAVDFVSPNFPNYGREPTGNPPINSIYDLTSGSSDVINTSTFFKTFGYDASDVQVTKTENTSASKLGPAHEHNWTANYLSNGLVSNRPDSNFSETNSKDGSAILQTLSGTNARHFGRSVERIEFMDKSLAVDTETSENGHIAMKLAQIAFGGRADLLMKGLILREVDAADFVSDSKASSQAGSKATEDSINQRSAVLTSEKVSQKLIDTYGSGISNDGLIGYLSQQIFFGSREDQAEAIKINSDLGLGVITQASLVTQYADLQSNLIQISGQQSKGMEYTPQDSKVG